VALYFVAVREGTILERYEVGDSEHREIVQSIDGKHLLGTKKYLWEEGRLSFVRSPEEAGGVAAFLVFHKVKNRLEETGIFQILAAQAVFIYSLNGATSDRSDQSDQPAR
jgi:hypothetical protein